MYIYHKQCEIMQKKSMKQLERPTSLISHWFPMEMVHVGPKLCKRKRFFLCCKFFSEVSRVCHMKADALPFPNMWWFFMLSSFKPELLLPKVGSNLKICLAKWCCQKKICVQLWVSYFHIQSGCSQLVCFKADWMAEALPQWGSHHHQSSAGRSSTPSPNPFLPASCFWEATSDVSGAAGHDILLLPQPWRTNISWSRSTTTPATHMCSHCSALSDSRRTLRRL